VLSRVGGVGGCMDDGASMCTAVIYYSYIAKSAVPNNYINE